MDQTYVAWNGEEYPWPPPDGWELKVDGRYWPADQGPATSVASPDPEPPAPAPAPPPPQTFGAPPPPGGYGGPSPGGGYAPPPGGGGYAPPPGPGGYTSPGPIDEPIGGPIGGPVGGPLPGSAAEKRSNTGRNILIGLLVFIALGVGGCVVLLAAVGDEISDFVDDLSEIEVAEESVTFDTCGEVNGQLIAEGSLENPRDRETDFAMTISWEATDGSQSTATAIRVQDVAANGVGRFRAVADQAPTSSEYTCEVAAFAIPGFGN